MNRFLPLIALLCLTSCVRSGPSSDLRGDPGSSDAPPSGFRLDDPPNVVVNELPPEPDPHKVVVVAAEPQPVIEAPPAALATETAKAAVDVQALIAAMTVEQKVGQLMMVGFAGTEVDDDIRMLVRGREVGGVCMFKRNILNAEQITRLNDDVRELLADAIPPFIAVDQEGGNVVRISEGMVVLPGNMALGATRSEQLAYEAGKVQGEDLRRLGFNMNLAPVLDVNVNPKNPVIGIRSFSDDPALVSALGRAFVKGQQDAQMVTIAKHFPGHGNTDADSHKALPVMKESEAELMRQISPFADVISDGLDGLMTAHVAMPRITGDDLPATLSKKILTDLLRQRMKFDGLVMTDELEMEAIADHYGVGRAAVMAISSGADMVLIPWRAEKKTEVYESLLEAARSGELPMARLNDAVRHVLEAKARRGMFEKPRPANERLAELQSDARHAVANEIGKAAVTLLRTDERSYPLPRNKKLLVITAEASLGAAIRRRDPKAVLMEVPAYPSSAKRAVLRDRARDLAAQADIIVVGLINARQLELVTLAASTGKPVVVVSMGLPYLAELANEARAVLALYSYRPSVTEAAAAALYGELTTTGKLPVSLKSLPFGHGLGGTAQRAEVAAPR
ncbi:MAG: beta-N-acetylhexosaminidase [Myxococcaceae bacterium]